MRYTVMFELNSDAGTGLQALLYTCVCVCVCMYVCVCVHTHREGEDQGGACRVAACGVQHSDAWSTPVCSPKQEAACTSDGFHIKQHRVDLV